MTGGRSADPRAVEVSADLDRAAALLGASRLNRRQRRGEPLAAGLIMRAYNAAPLADRPALLVHIRALLRVKRAARHGADYVINPWTVALHRLPRLHLYKGRRYYSAASLARAERRNYRAILGASGDTRRARARRKRRQGAG